MKKDLAVKKNLDFLNEFMNKRELHREMREKKVGRAYIHNPCWSCRSLVEGCRRVDLDSIL